MLLDYKIRALFLIIGLVIGLAIGNFLPLSKSEGIKEIHLGSSSTGLTNPLLECDLGKEFIAESSIRPFKSEISNLMDQLYQQGKAKFISYYFRELNNGAWFGFNEKEGFAPASLLKVPFMLFILKQAEKNPQLLEKKLIYESGQVAMQQFYQSEQAIKVGNAYTVKELLEAMIINSDNNATAILLKFFGSDNSRKVFDDLGIQLLPGIDNAGSISVRDYAAFFRILFNASYVNQESSEYALNLLTKTKFPLGLVSGVESNLRVAHKFGEKDNGKIKQLHDCGIVYTQKSPYLICIMTRGDNFSQLAEVISELSKATFNKAIQTME